MEGAGLALAVAALYNLAADAFHLIRDTLDFPRDASILGSKLAIEHSRFRSWGRYWGLSATTIENELHLTGLREHIRTRDNEIIIKISLSKLHSLFTDSEVLKSRYGLEDSPKNAAHKARHVLWAIKDKEKVEQLVIDTAYFVRAMYELLPPNVQASLQIGASGLFLDALDSLFTADTINIAATDAFQKSLAKAAEIKALALTLETEASVSTHAGNTHLLMQRSRQDLQLDPILGRQRTNSITRYKMHDGREILVYVEWRAMDRSLTDIQTDIMRKRFDDVARLLHSSWILSPDFRVLDCIGFVEDQSPKSIGFLNQLPSTVPSTSKTSSLAQLLRDHDQRPKDFSKPDLDQRFYLARTIAATMFRIHSTGWLHKNVRSDNVIFFHQLGERSNLNEPFLVGFGRARPDHPNEATEGMEIEPGNLFDVCIHSAYARGGRFRRSFDIYALGVVLFEIAFWEPATNYRKREDSRLAFQKRLVRRTKENVAAEVGPVYRDVVLACLEAPDQLQEEESAWLFWTVVRKLEICRV